MASNNSLQKLLVNVPSASCDAFIKQYIDPTWTAPTGAANTVVLPEVAENHNTAYDGKVVFLEKYHAIFTQGALFGYDKDFHNILADLIDGGIESNTASSNGVSVTTTLTYKAENENEQPKLKITNAVVVTPTTYSNGAWSSTTMTNVVDAQSVKNYVDDAVDAAAVTAMEYKGGLTQQQFNGFANAENKKSLDGNVYVATEKITIKPATETEKAVIAEIGDTIIVHYYKKDEVDTLDYVVIERSVDNTVTASGSFTKNQILVAFDDNQTAYTTGSYIGSDATTYTTFGNDNNANTLATEKATAAYIAYKIGQIDTAYTTVTYSGDYVNVSYALTTGGTTNDYTYTVSVVTKTLGDAVGMYVGEDGKWHAANGDVTADGLATAADVAKEIVENEKVIAAALNDHEARLDALENDIENLGDTITTSFESLDGTATVSDANSYVSVTINEVDGKLTNEGSSLTVQYGTVDADLKATTNGLIDAAQLANVLNNINLWETFNPETATPEA